MIEKLTDELNLLFLGVSAFLSMAFACIIAVIFLFLRFLFLWCNPIKTFSTKMADKAGNFIKNLCGDDL